MPSAASRANDGTMSHGPAPPAIRLSEAEREPVVEVLKVAYTQGRLGLDEFHARLHRALTVRTRDELAALTADLDPGAGARTGVARARPGSCR
jgi:hypothetical protein